MNKTFIIVIAFAFLFGSCTTNKTDNQHNHGTHTHEDGSVHENHTEEPAQQEEFTVPTDTVSQVEVSSDKNVDHEHPHTH